MTHEKVPSPTPNAENPMRTEGPVPDARTERPGRTERPVPDARTERPGRTERPVPDARTEYERMLADDWFRYRAGPELAATQRETLGALRDINAMYLSEPERATRLLGELVAGCGAGFDFRPPVYIEYRERVTFGANVFINADLVILGSGRVRIGDNALIGPGARFYTVNHPLDSNLRREGWEIGSPITIEDDVWLGGSVILCPGVTIGRGSVVGAGAVVTKNVPPGVVVGGNTARVLREI